MIERGQQLGRNIARKSAELRQSLAAYACESLIDKLGLQMSEQSQANLVRLNEVLVTDPAVVYINHTSTMDAPVAILMVLSQLPNSKQILGPVGMKHYDPKRDLFGAAGLRSLKLLGIHPMPVVQVDDEVDYGVRQSKMIEGLKEQTKNALNEPGSLYGIAPEGTRNKDGILQRAKRGIGYLERYSDRLYYTPTAIIYKNFSDQPQIAIGEPLQIGDILPTDLELPIDPKDRAQAIADIHMRRLAKLIPAKLRGFYAEEQQ
jgi:1-acyl-sn-glycerol-3-phosphate acyltransferase